VDNNTCDGVTTVEKERVKALDYIAPAEAEMNYHLEIENRGGSGDLQRSARSARTPQGVRAEGPVSPHRSPFGLQATTSITRPLFASNAADLFE